MARDTCRTPSHRDLKSSKSKTEGESESQTSSDSEFDHENGSKRYDGRKHSKRGERKRSRSVKRRKLDDSSSSTESEDLYSGSDLHSSSEGDEEKRRGRRERLSREGGDKEKERKRRREKEKERKRRRRKEKEREERKKEEKNRKKKKDKKKEKDRGKTGAVTDSWGKYGIIRETDMWSKRPEFTSWLAEVKQVNLESLPNWEEKQLFKEFMEDHNTATFPSKKYYDLDAYYQRQMEKEKKKHPYKLLDNERTVFNDEEQRRQELRREREKQKEEQLHALKLSMQSGMAQAMKEQAQLKEEMAYQYKLGNFEAAAAIQRRLDPDVAI
ncbi:hypothetical protein DM860_014870 [Cuscuta australis]|uniref:Uncharacterized protein n=2 Tax=Cuscuta sect. Cleistogrammica TaxID=1824901 RepID=A0A328DMP6_9ASTE|nr:hypothetical protein DM860_014870 [Cuscuta australis]